MGAPDYIAESRQGMAMPDLETAAMLRAVLDELCLGGPHDTEMRSRVASRLIEAVEQGKPSIDDLREIGRKILLQFLAVIGINALVFLLQRNRQSEDLARTEALKATHK